MTSCITKYAFHVTIGAVTVGGSVLSVPLLPLIGAGVVVAAVVAGTVIVVNGK